MSQCYTLSSYALTCALQLSAALLYRPRLCQPRGGAAQCPGRFPRPTEDMFDNKFFLISVAEASRMDPNERHLLELGSGEGISYDMT